MKPDIMNLQEARIVENNNLVLVDSLRKSIIHFFNRKWVFGFIIYV